MSYNIHAIFKIELKQLTEDFIAEVILAIYRNRDYFVSESNVRSMAQIIYKNSRGDFSTHVGLFKDYTPYHCILYFVTHKIVKKYSPPFDIKPGVAYMILSVPMALFDDGRESNGTIVGRALREAFVNDARAVYSAIHPEWGAMAMDLEIDGLMRSDPDHDPLAFLYPVNFYGPKLAKKVDKKIISKFEPEKLEELDDGGLLIQFGEYLHIAVMRDNKIPGEIRMKQMAKALAAMTGQNVWWKGHEKELGWEE